MDAVAISRDYKMITHSVYTAMLQISRSIAMLPYHRVYVAGQWRTEDNPRGEIHPCLDSPPHSPVSSSLLSSPLSSSITLSLQTQNLPFQQILPTFKHPGSAPDPAGGLQRSPDPLTGGEVGSLPLLKNPIPHSWPLGPPCFVRA